MAAEVRPIRTKRDYEAALKEVERLWGAKTGTRDGDRLDVLATLIDAYEVEHYPMDPPDPIEAIKFRMEQQGLTRRDLEEIIGTRTRIAEVMNRKRGLSIAMIRRLHERLGISAESGRVGKERPEQRTEWCACRRCNVLRQPATVPKSVLAKRGSNVCDLYRKLRPTQVMNPNRMHLAIDEGGSNVETIQIGSPSSNHKLFGAGLRGLPYL
jgi:HTH-type transcriptional regulator/antitoxin HigA